MVSPNTLPVRSARLTSFPLLPLQRLVYRLRFLRYLRPATVRLCSLLWVERLRSRHTVPFPPSD